MDFFWQNLYWIGPLIHIVITFVVADIVGTLIYKRTRKTWMSNIALQVHPAITFLSGMLFIWLWIPCR